MGGQGNWGRVCPLKNAFFQFSKIPYLAKRREKAFVFWGGGNFLSKKCALQCLLSLAPIRGWSVLLIEVWKSLFGARFLEAFCSVNPNPFTRTIFLCAKNVPKILSIWVHKNFQLFWQTFIQIKRCPLDYCLSKNLAHRLVGASPVVESKIEIFLGFNFSKVIALNFHS